MGLCCCFKSSSNNKVHAEATKPTATSQPAEVANKIQPVIQEPKSSASVDDWDYANCDDWLKKFPDANKSHQSPIDILTSSAVYDEELAKSPVQVKYESASFKEINNNGRTFVVTGSSQNSLVSGCGLANSYRFAQFHMHWGKLDSKGSEHLINGKAFAAEIHFVNWNYVKYPTFKEAAGSNDHDGLLVVGVLVTIGEFNPEFDKLANLIEEIKLSGKSAKLPKDFDVRKLFPNDFAKYWCYPGSLTTPPCTQSVKWIVLCEPIQVSSQQLAKFRNLHTCSNASECCESTQIFHNFRPVCKLGDRKILKSFE